MAEFRPLEPTRDTDQREEQKLAKKIKNFIYDPSDVIGSGFSSKVYKGINEHNNEQVAIKVIELAKIQNEVEKYLLNNEINALRALNHKNILKTIDILMTKNNVYIVTEFCEFGDLQQMIKNNKKLQQRDALNIARDVVEGYISIEQKNVIHRDLKTANIFLTKTGAKIADFGFCEFIGQRKPQIAYNVGSPAYMSPESYKENVYSHKSDIWGIGIILCEMLLGETPQKNLTYTEMSNNLMNGKIAFTQNEDIKQILVSCFRRDTKQRTDARTLLQNIVKVIEKLERQDNVKNIKNPNGNDSRFSKNFQMTSNEPIRSSLVKQEYQKKFSTDEKKFVSVSPSKMARPNEEPVKQYSSIQPMSLDHGSRALSNKKQGLGNSNMFQHLQVNKAQQPSSTIPPSKRLKSNIMMLQFVFRLFKYLNDVSLPIFSFIKLLLFRHRSYIDQVTDILLDQNRVELGSSELYKEFQFLKKKFDSAYLDRENSSGEQGNHELMNTMNKLANLSFIDTQCINSYRDLIRRGCEDLQNEVNDNRSNAFALWDYLMLEYEILTLYGEGLNDEVIAAEKVPLESILREQPKSISKMHIDLLRVKCRYLFENGRADLPQISQPHTPSSIITPYHGTQLVKHMSN